MQNHQIALDLLRKVSAIPGAVDVHIHQQFSYPTVQVNVDRDRAQQIGLQQKDVANSMLISLSGSGQTAPNQWLNPETGVNYQVVAQSPQYRIDSFECPSAHSDYGEQWNEQPIAREPGDAQTRGDGDCDRPLQHSAHLRHLCRCRPARLGWRGEPGPQDYQAERKSSLPARSSNSVVKSRPWSSHSRGY